MSDPNDFIIENGVLKQYKGSDANVVVPDGVEVIGETAFFEHREIQTISLPAGLMEIEGQINGGAFYGCTGLTHITLPDSVNTVGYAAFYGCSKLQEIQMPLAAITNKMFGSSGKTIIMVLTQPEAEPVRVVASFRKDYWVQTWSYPKDYLLPITADAIPYYDRLLASGSYDGFGINEEGRVRACLWRLLDPTFPIEKEVLPGIRDFLTSKITKALKFAEQDGSAAYVQALVDLGAVHDDNRKKVNRALAKSPVPELQAMADHLVPSSAAVAQPVEEAPSIEPHLATRLREINATAVLLKSGVTALPEVSLSDGSGSAPADYLRLILAEYIELGKSGDLRPIPAAEEAAEKLERASLQKALRSIYDACRNEKQQLALLMPLFRYADGSTIREIFPGIYQSSWKQDTAKRALLLNDTREAMLYADKHHFLGLFALLRNMDTDTLRDTVLADFGFDDHGSRVFDLGNTSLIVSVAPDLSLTLFDEAAGKTVKSVPKKGADPEKYEAVKSALAELKKNVKRVAKSRGELLFEMFLSGGNFRAEAWITAYTKNPVLNAVARLLVWTQGKKTFTLTEDGAVDSAEKPYEIKSTPIRLAHPMEMRAADLTAWQKYFTAHGLKQPFSQIWEPVIDPATVQEDRYAGCMIPYYRFLKQEKHGIRAADYDFHNDIEISFMDCDAVVERIDWRQHEIDVNDRFEVKTFRFNNYTRQVNHVVAYLDRVTVWDRVRLDDISVMDMMDTFTLAQITEFILTAQEAGAANVLAALLEYKNTRFADFDPMDDFTLEW